MPRVEKADAAVRAKVCAIPENQWPPPLVALEVNDRCASHCSHCSYGFRHYPQLAPLETLQQALAEAAAYGCRVLYLSSREPFLNRAAAERSAALVQAARQSGFVSVGAVSSLRFVGNGAQRFAERGLRLDLLDVSVDGVGPAHDVHRGVKEIHLLSEPSFWDTARALADHVGASVTVHRRNVEQVGQLLDFLASFAGIDGILIATMSVNGLNDAALGLSPGQFERLLEAVTAWLQKRNTPYPKVSVELTPCSVPDLCQLVRRGVLDPSMVQLSPEGLPVLFLPSGLSIRILAGSYQYGPLLVIRGDGWVRFSYQRARGRQDYAGCLRNQSLGKILREWHQDKARIWRPLFAAACKKPHLVSCPAFAFHLDQGCELEYRAEAEGNGRA